MKKLFLLLVFFCTGIQAQNEASDLPNYTLPSPEAHAFTKYGNVPINESTGKVTASVPIYTFTAGQLSLPISLNYMGNGVKVNQNNTWTGVNWTLNAGGVITRTIHHKVDEKAYERIFQAEIDSLIAQYDDELANAEVMNSYFNSPTSQWDTQPDIFNFSFAGHSGSFYLNKDFIPTLINEDSNLKIEILGPDTETDKYNLYNTKQFKITDTNGIEYYFGGSLAVEETFMEQNYHEVVTPTGTTSFYLTEIKHPLNGHIFLEYVNGGSHKIATSQNKTIVIYNSGGGFDGGCSDNPDDTEPMEATNDSNYNSNIVYTKINSSVVLSRIFAPYHHNYQVKFNSTPQFGFNASNVLNKIEILNGNKEVDFEYIYDLENSSINRFFLEKVIFDKNISNNTQQNKEYRFDYKTPLNLPKRFSKAQDALGYYNGKDNNSTLLPDVSLLPSGSNGSAGNVLSNCSYCDADRTTDLDYKTMGTLTKIYYPTGGHTLFEYEPIIAKSTSTKQILMDIWSNDSQRLPSNKLTADSGIGGFYIPNDDDASPGETSVFETHEVTATINITTESPNGLDYHDYILFEIEDLTTGLTTPKQCNFPTDVFDTGFDTTFFTFDHSFTLIKDHDYEFRLSFQSSDNYFTSTPMYATVIFDYINGYQEIEGEGLRVKRVSDYTGDLTGAKNIKRYYYKKAENVFDNSLSSLPVYKVPLFYEQHQLLMKSWLLATCGDPGAVPQKKVRNELTCLVETTNGYSLSIFPSNYSEFQLNNYENVVISYGGDNFENGGIAKTFTLEGGSKVMDYHIGEIGSLKYKNLISTHKNAPWLNLFNGKLKKEVYLKRGADVNELYKIKENIYAYTNQMTSVESIITGAVVNDCGPGYLFPFSRVGLGKYDIFSRRIHIENQTSTDYLDPVPISTNIFNPIIDESNYRKITSTTDYEYGSYAGQPIKVTTTTSESNIKKFSTTSYVDTAGSLSSLDPDQLTAYTTLENEHRIGNPIQTESFEMVDGVSTLLGKQRTLYKTFPNGLTQENIVQSAKETDALEDRIIYNKYDGRGNPVELYKKNGTPVVYIWATLFNKPTVKIVNATYDEALAALSDLRTNLPNAQVTEYTYTGVLHQLSSVTDPRGYKTYYTYDELNRLKYVKDASGNILSKNEYNYKN